MENNCENVLLDGILDNIVKGFYVSITTGNSSSCSMLKVLYQNGWRGINIDADEEYLNSIAVDRPEDTYLNIVIDDSNNYVETSEGSRHSFDVVLYEHKVKKIHFLKISVNHPDEKKILEGLFLTDIRPSILMIEFKINRASKNLLDWENLLLENGYEAIPFNKIHKIYLAKECKNLYSLFQNVTSTNDCECFNANVEQELLQLSEKIQENDNHGVKLTEYKTSFLEIMSNSLKKFCKLKKTKEKVLKINVSHSLFNKTEKNKADDLLDYALFDQLSLHYLKNNNLSFGSEKDEK